MKKILFLGVVLVALAGQSAIHAEEMSSAPNYNNVKEIKLSGLEGTILRIFPDGAGALSTTDKVSKYPRHTFSFSGIYYRLLPTLMKNDDRERVIAMIPPAPSEVSYKFHVQDQHLINHLLSEAGVAQM